MAREPIHVLVVDDDNHLLGVYEQMIAATPGFVPTALSDPRRALVHARERLFDLVVIDAKLEYRGDGLGGLRLAEDLHQRYGDSSEVIVSQYITRELMEACGSHFEFLDKGSVPSPKAFVKALCQRMRAMWAKQTVFVAMPFAPEYAALYRAGIKPAVEQLGLRCVRADELSHNRSIHDVMFRELAASKFVVFVADGANPNAYYEAGYAHALGKEVVAVARAHGDLLTDIKHRHTIFHGGQPKRLRDELLKKTRAMLRANG